jgi:hypothetical protein
MVGILLIAFGLLTCTVWLFFVIIIGNMEGGGTLVDGPFNISRISIGDDSSVENTQCRIVKKLFYKKEIQGYKKTIGYSYVAQRQETMGEYTCWRDMVFCIKRKGSGGEDEYCPLSKSAHSKTGITDVPKIKRNGYNAKINYVIEE